MSIPTAPKLEFIGASEVRLSEELCCCPNADYSSHVLNESLFPMIIYDQTP